MVSCYLMVLNRLKDPLPFLLEITTESDMLLDRTETDKALMEARKRYKTTQSQISRVSSHEEFTRECQGKNLTPRALQVRVRCHALLPSYTDVREKFKHTANLAEGEFKMNLEGHYRTTR